MRHIVCLTVVWMQEDWLTNCRYKTLTSLDCFLVLPIPFSDVYTQYPKNSVAI